MTISELKVSIGADLSDFDKKFSKLEGSLNKTGKKLKNIGSSMTKFVTLPLIGIGAASVKMASDVDGSLREVNTLFGKTGAEADKTFESLKSGVASLSNELGIAQDTLSKGLYTAISAGVPKENVFDFMRVASKAAIAGVTDVDTAIDGITTTINAFGLETSNSGAVADSMFAAVKGGKTTFEELSQFMANVAPAAAAANVGFREVNAAIATLTATGTQTSVATTQIRAALVGLQKPSEELNTVFQKVGFSSAQAAIEQNGLGFALKVVKDASNGNNGVLQKMLGSVEAVGAANVLAGTGIDKFNQELKRQKNSLGSTTDAFNEMEKSNKRAMEKLGVAFSNASISIGKVFIPVVTKLADILTNVVNWFQQLDDSTKTWIVGLGSVLAVAGPVIASIGFFATTILPTLRAGLVAVKLAQIGLNGAMAANPIGLIVTGVGLLVAALVLAWNKSEKFRGAIKGLGAVIMNFVDNVKTNFTKIPKIVFESLKAVPKAIIDTFKGLGSLIKAIFTGNFKSIPNILKDLGKNIIKANPFTGVAVSLGKEFGKGTGKVFTKTLNKEIEKGSKKVEKTAGVVKDVFVEEAKTTGKEFTENFATATRKNLSKMKLKGGGIPVSIPDMPKRIPLVMPKVEVEKLSTKIKKVFGTDIFKSFKKVASKIGGSIANATKKAFEGLKGFSSVFTSEMENFGSSFDSLINGDVLGAIVGVFGDFAKNSKGFQSLLKTIGTALNGVMNSFMPIFDAFSMAMQPLVPIITKFAEFLSGAMLEVLGAIIDPLTKFLGLVTDVLPLFQNLIAVVSKSVGKIMTLIVDALEPMMPTFEKVLGAVTQLIEPLMELFTVIFQTLNPVIQSLTEALGSILSAVLKSLIPIIKSISMSLIPLQPLFNMIAISLHPITLLFDMLGKAIDKLLKKFGVDTSKLAFNGGGSDFTIPKMAKGGIVNSPTTALIGEAGPEAVIPLDKLSGMVNNSVAGGEVVFRLSGTELIGLIQNTNNNRGRLM